MTSATETANLNESGSPTQSARQLLVDWANRQDSWVRQLVFDVLSSGRPVPGERISEISHLFVAEKGLSDESPRSVPKLEYQESLGDIVGELVFHKLSNVQGVNALAADQEIAFSPGLTILFGENGTGKTGYARILKGLADVRTAEHILPNVHQAGAAPAQEAHIEYSVGSDNHVLEWRGETGVSPITRVCVFDSPAVRLHVDEDLSYVYTPRDLALFKAVSEGIDGVKDAAEQAASERRLGRNPYLPHFERGTPIYTQIETLGSATDLEALRKLGDVTEQDKEAAKLLRTSVAAMESGSITDQLAAARDRVQLYDDLNRAASVIRSFNMGAYNQAIMTAREATDAYVALRAELLADAGINDGSEDAWQDFILRAESYREHLALHEYPQQGDPCLYCRQPLGSDATALVARYRNFATDVSRKRIADANSQAKSLTQAVMTIDIPALASAVQRRLKDEPDDKTLTAADSLLTNLQEQSSRLQQQQEADWEPLSQSAASIEEDAANRRTAAEKLVQELSARAADRTKKLQEDSAKLKTLTARIELAQRLDEIVQTVEDAKWAQKLDQLTKRFPALLRSLTEVSKTASEQLLNGDFERRFATECKALRAPTIRLEFPGRRGEPARRKVVSTEYRPSQVLSEGEQKVIALADFLAETQLQTAPAPVIFDDPVNSLDYRRIGEVAHRIAQLADDRQVIVFTHSIWLATELLGRFEKRPERCKYLSVTDDGGKGIVTAGTGPRWDTVKSITKKINELIASGQSANGEARDAIIETAYSRLRSWCEVVVETDLLKGVTKRHQANVMMTMLPQIRGDRLAAATEVINPIFEKACRIMEGHSQPLETLSVRPTLEELEADWKELQDARAAYIA